MSLNSEEDMQVIFLENPTQDSRRKFIP